MTNTATPVAAWYPDPAGHAELRWWDGTRWTAEVRSPTARPGASLDAPLAPAARGAHVVETASPAAPPSIPMTPAEERTALYASLQAAHSAEMSPSHAASPSALAPPWSGSTQFAASASPDPYRAKYEEKSYQAWRKNTAATSALVFAGINLGLLVYTFFQHYSPYYRIVPSVIGIAAAFVALRQARQTDTGLVKSLIALIVNVVIGAIAAVALVQLGLGIATGSLSGLLTPGDYSIVVEEALMDAITDEGHPTTAVVCPDEVVRTVGARFTCEELHADGSTEQITVQVGEGDDLEYWYEP